MPLPLYGSGGRTCRISAAAWPTFCLSIPSTTMVVGLGVEIVTYQMPTQLEQGKVALLEVTLDDGSPADGKTVRDLNLPPDSTLVGRRKRANAAGTTPFVLDA
jgi:hypothetical protein